MELRQKRGKLKPFKTQPFLSYTTNSSGRKSGIPIKRGPGFLYFGTAGDRTSPRQEPPAAVFDFSFRATAERGAGGGRSTENVYIVGHFPGYNYEKQVFSKDGWTMELTEVEKNLISGLKLNGAKLGTVSVILLLLKSEEDQLDMLEHVLENEETRDEELLNVAYKIAGHRI
ncbi:MAG: hypothetical protein IJ042_04010 [Butyricicoccus sp.]|nr:hypothetical protein [Butyricicoccus sp.]